MQSSFRRNSISKFSFLYEQIQLRMSSSICCSGRKFFRKPCVTILQPWASLLVDGIKRVEARPWKAPIRGRLWIHASGREPDFGTIKSIEDFYKGTYALDGINDIKFPKHYPISKLLGCVDVVGCVSRRELLGWVTIPERMRLEGQSDFCWLCENPQKLVNPLDMKGQPRIYDLDRELHHQAAQGLRSVKISSPFKFRLPNPEDPFSLSPGSVLYSGESSSSVIAGAGAASKQYLPNNGGGNHFSVR